MIKFNNYTMVIIVIINNINIYTNFGNSLINAK